MALSSIHITKTIKTIEALKCELLSNIAKLFSALVDGTKESMQKTVLSSTINIIIFSYYLAKRLGIGYEQVNAEIIDNLTHHKNNYKEIECEDIDELTKFFKQSK